MALIPTIFAVGIIIGNRVQAVLAQLFQSKLLLVKMERMAVCAFEAGQRHEYECRKCMYVKGQAGSGRHNTCIVVERKKEDGCMNECGNVEAIDLSGQGVDTLGVSFDICFRRNAPTSTTSTSRIIFSLSFTLYFQLLSNQVLFGLQC